MYEITIHRRYRGRDRQTDRRQTIALPRYLHTWRASSNKKYRKRKNSVNSVTAACSNCNAGTYYRQCYQASFYQAHYRVVRQEESKETTTDVSSSSESVTGMTSGSKRSMTPTGCSEVLAVEIKQTESPVSAIIKDDDGRSYVRSATRTRVARASILSGDRSRRPVSRPRDRRLIYPGQRSSDIKRRIGGSCDRRDSITQSIVAVSWWILRCCQQIWAASPLKLSFCWLTDRCRYVALFVCRLTFLLRVSLVKSGCQNTVAWLSLNWHFWLTQTIDVKYVLEKI